MYFDQWSSRAEMVKDFLGYDVVEGAEGTPKFPTSEEILFAQYGSGGYDGSCLVLFEQDGKVFSVEGGHCSCYGLEDQWSPVETSWKALQMCNRDFDSGGKLSQYDCSREAYDFFFWALVDSRRDA